MKLMETIRSDFPLTTMQRSRLKRIEKEDLTGVARKAREELSLRSLPTDDAYVSEGLLAWQQYCAVAVLDPYNEHAVSAAIDPFWHAHILHTREYTFFCQEVCGQYMHHEPLDHEDIQSVAKVASLYGYTVGVYKRIFSYVNPVFYPDVAPSGKLVCRHMNLDDTALRADTIFKEVTSLTLDPA